MKIRGVEKQPRTQVNRFFHGYVDTIDVGGLLANNSVLKCTKICCLEDEFMLVVIVYYYALIPCLN